MEIRNLLAEHWAAIKSIYEGIVTGHASFQAFPADWPGWDSRYLSHSRLVAIEGDRIVGWAALAPVSTRSVYAGVAEVNIYIATGYPGQKAGESLLKAVIDSSEMNNVWTLQANIFFEYDAVLKMHASIGFRLVGYRERICQTNGVWRDLVVIERRSQKVG
jgi:L-amino acid N-acyltransferase YncA